MIMKIEIVTTAKTVENVNFILGQAIDALMQNGAMAKKNGTNCKRCGKSGTIQAKTCEITIETINRLLNN